MVFSGLIMVFQGSKKGLELGCHDTTPTSVGPNATCSNKHSVAGPFKALMFLIAYVYSNFLYPSTPFLTIVWSKNISFQLVSKFCENLGY